MHHPTYRITHTTAFVTSVVEHWLEREIAQWVAVPSIPQLDGHGWVLSVGKLELKWTEGDLMSQTLGGVLTEEQEDEELPERGRHHI